MMMHKIKQKSFAELVLNMKQANFSTMLSQPLSWSTVSRTAKDRFLIMYMWLEDPKRIEKYNRLESTPFT